MRTADPIAMFSALSPLPSRPTSRALFGGVAVLAVIVGLLSVSVPAGAAPSGSVSGVVLDPGGDPLADVCVTATGGPTVYTDAAGAYQIGGLAGEVRVSFVDCAAQPVHLTQWYLGATEESAATPVWVEDGTEVVLNTVSMVAGVVISGTVTDPSGTPLPGISVDVQPVAPGLPGLGVNTDALGEYRTPPLLDGEYTVGFRDNSPSPVWALQFWNGSTRRGDAARLFLNAGSATSITGVDAAMRPASSVTGRVTGAGGTPLAGVCVEAVDDYEWFGSTQTGPDGSYVLGGLSATSMKVRFSPCSAGPGYLTQWWNGAEFPDDAQSVVLGEGSTTTGIDAALQLGATVRGTVRGPGGVPLEGICVNAVSSDGDGVGWASTSAAGTYEMVVSPQAVRIIFQECDDEGGRYIPQWFDHVDSWEDASILELAPGEERTGIDADLEPAGVLRGRVTDNSGTPLGEICVQASTTDFLGGSTRTREDGTWTLGVAEAGTYRIQFVDCADDPGHVGRWWGGTLDPSTAVGVTVAPGDSVEGLDTTLDEGSAGVVRGSVRTVRGSVPPNMCIVVYLADRQTRFAAVAADGSFEVPGVASGTWVVALLGCPSGSGDDDIRPTIDDGEVAGLTYAAIWWGGAPILFPSSEGGPDPFAQGARFLTVVPEDGVSSASAETPVEMCLGCGAISVSSVVVDDSDMTVGFAPESDLASPGAGVYSYALSCDGVSTVATGANSPLSLAALPAGSRSCRVTALLDGVVVLSSDDFAAVVAGVSNESGGSTTTTTPSGSGPSTTAPTGQGSGSSPSQADAGTTNAGGRNPARLAATGGDTVPAAAVGTVLLLGGLLAGLASRRRRTGVRSVG